MSAWSAARKSWCAASLAVALCLSAGTCLAQNDPYQVARSEYQRGIAALRRHDAATAIEAFERSYAIRPAPVVTYNLALALEEARRNAEAVEAFDRYLRDPVTVNAPSPTSVVRQEADRLRRQVAMVTLRGVPANATVRVVGSERRITRETFALDPGAHTIEVSAEGFRTARQELRVREGEVREVTVHLDAVTAEAPVVRVERAPNGPSEVPRAAPRVDEPARRTAPVWAWVAGGVAVLAAGSAVGVGLYGNGLRDDYEGDRECRAWPYPARCEGVQERLDTLAPIVYGLWALAGAGAITATVGFLVGRTASPRTRVQPVVSLNHMGVRLSW